MEVVSNARGYRDDHHRLPILSLGLSSVRLIVNKIETQHARAKLSDTDTFKNTREIVKYDPTGNDCDDFPVESSTGRAWNRFVVNLGTAFYKCVPSVTHSNFGILVVATSIISPNMITYLVIYPLCRLICGTLYPAYASYKAVRTKNLKEYVKWMMYWIVFAIFTFVETITDVFLSWFPFYYEVKIVLVIWLLSPATKGSSILYRKFVHPELCKREQGIDEYIAKAKDHGYHTVLNLGTRGVNYATTVIMQTAIKNLNLPNPEQPRRPAIKNRDRDVTDGLQEEYMDIEYQQNDNNMSDMVRIVELDDGDTLHDLYDHNRDDQDRDEELTSARSRGNVVRKQKVVKEKRARSRSRGRRTRSQTAQAKETDMNPIYVE